MDIPDPTSDAGERLLQRNTETNVDIELVGRVERLILSDQGRAVQVAQIDSLEELTTWDRHQQYLLAQNARRAVLLTTAAGRKFADEDKQRVRTAFIVRRREEQRVHQRPGVDWFQMISDNSQWVEKEQPRPRVGKRSRDELEQVSNEKGDRAPVPVPEPVTAPLQAPLALPQQKQSYENRRRAAARARVRTQRFLVGQVAADAALPDAVGRQE
jgi:hypothetical protein